MIEGACSAWMQVHYPPDEVAANTRGSALAAMTSSDSGRATGVFPSSTLPFFHLVVFVPSGADARGRRDALRAQFAATAALLEPHALKTALFFVVADNAADALNEESAELGDVIFVPCADHDGDAEPAAGSSTTCKVVKALHYAVESMDFLYWARVGDDAFFRFDVFLLRISPAHTGNFLRTVFARFVPGGELTPALRAAYATNALAGYPAGSGYVLGAGVARALAEVDTRLGLIDGWPEDGVAGLWLSGLSIERVDSPCFHDTALLPSAEERDWSHLRGVGFFLGGWSPRMPWEPPPRRFNAGPCGDDSLLVHYMTPTLWASIDKKGVLNECGHMF